MIDLNYPLCIIHRELYTSVSYRYSVTPTPDIECRTDKCHLDHVQFVSSKEVLTRYSTPTANIDLD